MRAFLPSRRDWLRLGALGTLGLAPALGQSGPNHFGRAKRCLLLFLTGGPPQHDTWDPKPSAPEKIRGELRPIATAVPGLQFSELFPLLGQSAHRLCVVRSVTHGDRAHTPAGYTMLTGVPHPKANVESSSMASPGPGDHPHFGSIASLVRKPGPVPPFVSLPEVIKDASVNEYPGQTAGFLNRRYDPFRIEADGKRTSFLRPTILPPEDVTARRLDHREDLRGLIDRVPVPGPDVQFGKAFDVSRSTALRRGFDLKAESPRTHERYGRHLFGQGCLLARRLLEAGVGVVTVYWHYEGPDDSPVWDAHQNIYKHMPTRLASPADRAISAVIEDLAVRGMLDDTLVIVMGEFGRTPRINGHAGRDHWGLAQTILLAGAGIPAGAVYGSTDRDGGTPAERPITPADLTATILHLLGVPADLELTDRTGRVLKACHGRPVAGLVT